MTVEPPRVAYTNTSAAVSPTLDYSAPPTLDYSAPPTLDYSAPPDWSSVSVSAAALLVMAVFVAVLCACLLGPRLARLAAGCCCCLCELPPLPPLLPPAAGAAGHHIPYSCGQTQGGGGAPELCLMCDRGAAALTEQRRTMAMSARRDAELGLPPALPLPDGEEFPHSVNHIHIRTPEQEKEIYQACIRPPPNRTVGGRQPSPSAVTSTSAAASCARRAKSPRSRLQPRCAPPVNADPALTVIVPVRRAELPAGAAPRPPERRYDAIPPPGAADIERRPSAQVATSTVLPVAPPVTRSGRRLVPDVPVGSSAGPARRVSGRLAARAAAAAAGLFSRQRWQ